MDGALTVAMAALVANRAAHAGLSAELLSAERVEGESLEGWLSGLHVPTVLREYVLEGRLPDREGLGLSLGQARLMMLSGGALDVVEGDGAGGQAAAARGRGGGDAMGLAV